MFSTNLSAAMTSRFYSLIIAALSMGSELAYSFSAHNSQTNQDVNRSLQRRQLLQSVPCLLFTSPQISNAAMENTQTVFKVGQSLTPEEAKARFQEARRSLHDLIQNYDEISRDGGDNVRRYLGTVGTVSGLYGIQKVLRILQEEANDIVEYTENMSDFEYYLSAADTAVYSANFVEYSAAKTKPEKFFADAKKDVQQMKTCMDRMAQQLSL